VDGPVADLDRRIGDEAGGDAGAVWSAYYDSLSALIVDGGFEILGHFDLIRKNNRAGRLFDEDSPAYLGAAMGAARLLAGRGIVVEVNVGGMARGKTATPYPALAVLKELRSLGVPITISADAHAIAHLGSHIGDARELARAAGYRGVAVLSGGAWREVGLDET
jgi:histidinol-phosphatase (PHP family)